MFQPLLTKILLFFIFTFWFLMTKSRTLKNQEFIDEIYFKRFQEIYGVYPKNKKELELFKNECLISFKKIMEDLENGK